MGNDETKDLKKELEEKLKKELKEKLKDKIEFKKKLWDANGNHVWISDDKMEDCLWHNGDCYFIIDQNTIIDETTITIITYHFPSYGKDACEKIGKCLNPQYTVIEDYQHHKRILVTEIKKDNIDDVTNSIKKIEDFIKELKEKNNEIYNTISPFEMENQFPTEETPNVIFYGAPGTGKTFAVHNYMKKKSYQEWNGKKEKNADGYYKLVQFHPSFTYEDFIEGLKPTGVAKNGSAKLELVNGIFKDFCKQALQDIEKPYYFVVDEINRANLSTVFGETLSLLEPSYRDKILNKEGKEIRNLIDIQYSALERKASDKSDLFYDSENKGKFGIPKNIRFIGMMNDVDKSIDAFDLALRRRFKWVRKDCNLKVVTKELLNDVEEKLKGNNDNKLSEECKSSVRNFKKSCEKLNKFISAEDQLGLGKSYEFGHSFFLKMKDIVKDERLITQDHKKILFDEYLCPTLKEYLRSEINSESELEKKLKEAKNIFVQ